VYSTLGYNFVELGLFTLADVLSLLAVVLGFGANRFFATLFFVLVLPGFFAMLFFFKLISN
jgi:hypothetical protein